MDCYPNIIKPYTFLCGVYVVDWLSSNMKSNSIIKINL